ncbi:MAG TPA: transposase [Pseudonocardiaceae bacterium]|nr:transposase [Pseudonocardiaceae bacterium]
MPRGVVFLSADLGQTVSFHAACRFFSHAVWEVDRLGLLAARLIVERLLGADEPITVVIDETLFKRWGRKSLLAKGPDR